MLQSESRFNPANFALNDGDNCSMDAKSGFGYREAEDVVFVLFLSFFISPRRFMSKIGFMPGPWRRSFSLRFCSVAATRSKKQKTKQNKTKQNKKEYVLHQTSS
jgi:hypothetical protein